MATEQELEPKSRGDVLTWVSIGIGVAGLVMAGLPYVLPPDPLHPIRFHFLFRTISIPLWGTVLGIIAIAGGAFRLGQGRKKKTELADLSGHHTLTSATPSTSKPAIPLPAKTRRLPIPPSATGGEELAIESPDDYVINIRRFENAGMKGLSVNLDNHRLDTMGKVLITIFSAQGFSSYQGQFRDGYGFTAVRYAYQGNITSSSSSLHLWLIRKDPSRAGLLASDDSSHEMV
jgi:hypothetical protein